MTTVVDLGGFRMCDNMNEDKSPKDEQPWDRQFGEDNSKEKQYSRSARNAKGRAVAPLTSVLLFVFLIVAVAPVLFMMWFYYTSSRAEVKPRTADEVMLTKVVETTTSTTTTAEETTAATTTTTPTTVAPNDTRQRAETTAEARTTAQANGNYGTYTVQAGETLYRIAVNHGMDVDTLKSINGLTSNNISPGMQLRVLQRQQ